MKLQGSDPRQTGLSNVYYQSAKLTNEFGFVFLTNMGRFEVVSIDGLFLKGPERAGSRRDPGSMRDVGPALRPAQCLAHGRGSAQGYRC